MYFPASCTVELQPLNVGVDEDSLEDFKQLIKASFSRWYTDEVKVSMDEGRSVCDIKVDLSASVTQGKFSLFNVWKMDGLH